MAVTDKQKKTLPLKEIPSDVHETICDEQARLQLFEKQSLKREQVVYNIIREWRKLKNTQL